MRDPRLLWPETLAIQDGYLYILVDQLNRQRKYHSGRDGRVKPYVPMRLKIDARPVVLKEQRCRLPSGHLLGAASASK